MEKKIEVIDEDNCWRYKCSDGYHDSFWKTVVESPQWKEWEKEVARRLHKQLGEKKMNGVWDIDECRECGWISQEHFQDFLEWIKK